MSEISFKSSARRDAEIVINNARNEITPLPRAEFVDDLIRVLLRYRNGSCAATAALSHVAAAAALTLECVIANDSVPVGPIRH